MSQRSKNLLEAFNQSKAPEKSAEPAAQPRGSAPRVGGPFADSAPAAPARVQPKAIDPRPSAVDAARSPRERIRVVILCAVVAGIFFFIGRASKSGTQAAGTATPSTAGAALSASPAPNPVQRTNAQGNDAALLDPTNQATILAITYNNFNDETERLATATKARMIALDLPASISRNPTKQRIYVLVGAAPKLSDLDSLLLRVKSATSDRGKQDFASAYSVPIDNYVVRKTH